MVLVLSLGRAAVPGLLKLDTILLVLGCRLADQVMLILRAVLVILCTREAAVLRGGWENDCAGSTKYQSNYSSPYLHHVKISGLEPNAVYYYTVGDGNPEQTSPVLNFTTAPLPGTTGFRWLLQIFVFVFMG